MIDAMQSKKYCRFRTGGGLESTRVASQRTRHMDILCRGPSEPCYVDRMLGCIATCRQICRTNLLWLTIEDETPVHGTMDTRCSRKLWFALG